MNTKWPNNTWIMLFTQWIVFTRTNPKMLWLVIIYCRKSLIRVLILLRSESKNISYYAEIYWLHKCWNWLATTNKSYMKNRTSQSWWILWKYSPLLLIYSQRRKPRCCKCTKSCLITLSILKMECRRTSRRIIKCLQKKLRNKSCLVTKDFFKIL